jgi:hypothetical protein
MALHYTHPRKRRPQTRLLATNWFRIADDLPSRLLCDIEATWQGSFFNASPRAGCGKHVGRQEAGDKIMEMFFKLLVTICLPLRHKFAYTHFNPATFSKSTPCIVCPQLKKPTSHDAEVSPQSRIPSHRHESQ